LNRFQYLWKNLDGLENMKNNECCYHCERQRILLRVVVQPGAKNNQVGEVMAGRLKIRVRGKAVDGMANRALIEYLSKLLKVSKSKISLLKGEKSRQKLIAIEGLDSLTPLGLELS